MDTVWNPLSAESAVLNCGISILSIFNVPPVGVALVSILMLMLMTMMLTLMSMIIIGVVLMIFVWVFR